MSSLLPEYEYDIFISYRHNDNRSGWVTDFVNALQEELAATIKEPLSIYFDKNPHDGLLETHIVDKTLEGKLKCLIFIPIISQTYCDLKSFAWQHEFVAFNKLTQQDTLGRDIKLINGNIASRILPVKIHELDPDDKLTIENEVGGILRSIEFIFKSPGVNRPLSVAEQEPRDNQNKTNYRNQINKVANAVKEILIAIKNPTTSYYTTISEKVTVNAQSSTTPKRVLITSLLSILLLCTFGYFLYQKTNSKKLFDKREISIAVLPFDNLSSHEDQAYFNEGITEMILNNLTKIDGLHVRSKNSTIQYKGTTKSITEIGNELNVSNILSGSVQRSENQVRIIVSLIDVSTDRQIWSEMYHGEWNSVLTIQSEIAYTVADVLRIKLTDTEQDNLNKLITNNPEAYDFYLKGLYEENKYSTEGNVNARAYFSKALQLDSSFSYAHSGMASAIIGSASIFGAEREALDALNLAKPYLDKALELDPLNMEAHAFLGFYFLYRDWDFDRAQIEYSLLENNPKNAEGISIYIDYLNFTKQHEKALQIAEQELAIDFYYPNPRKGYCLFYLNRVQEAIDFQKSRLGVNSYWTYDTYGFVLLNSGKPNEAINYFEKAIELVGKRTPRMLGWLGAAHAKLGDKEKAEALLEELIELRKETNAGAVNFFIAVIYAALDNKTEAMNWLQRAYTDHDMEIPWLITEPQFYNLHSQIEFIELVEKIGFPEESIKELRNVAKK